MDKKTRPLYILSPADTPEKKRYTQTTSLWMEKNISCKWKGKKIWGSNTYTQQNRL